MNFLNDHHTAKNRCSTAGKMFQYCVTKISEACFVIWYQVGVWFWGHQAYERWQCTAARNGKSLMDKLCLLLV